MRRDFKLPDSPKNPIIGKSWSSPKRVRLKMDCVDNLVRRDVLEKLHKNHIVKTHDAWWISPEAAKIPMYLYRQEYHWLDGSTETI
jgi:hypothetical protein